MKYIKRFSKVSDYEAFKGGGEYITPNISLIDDGKRVYSEKKITSSNNDVLTFPLKFKSSDAIEVNEYDYETYYVFAPSNITQQLITWVKEQGLNFNANHAGSSGGNDNGTISLNQTIMFDDYVLTYATTDEGRFDVGFLSEDSICELCIDKDNSYVSVSIYK